MKKKKEGRKCTAEATHLEEEKHKVIYDNFFFYTHLFYVAVKVCVGGLEELTDSC